MPEKVAYSRQPKVNRGKMRIFLVLILTVGLVNPLFAHLCHDPFRPEGHLVLVPEEELIRMEKIKEFRMYVENTFDSPLRQIKLLVKNPAFDIKIKPAVIKRLLPGERTFFVVKLNLREGFKPGDYPLKIEVSAQSAEIEPSIEKMEVVIDEQSQAGEAGKIVVQVKKSVWEGKYYFYLILTILFIWFLLWRRFKQK